MTLGTTVSINWTVRLARRIKEGVGVRGDRVRLERVQFKMGYACFRLIEDVGKSVEFLGIDIAVEFASEKELELQSIHFAARNSSDTSVVLIVEVDIVAIFGSKENAGDKETMDGPGVDEHGTLVPDNAIKVDKGDDEALHSAWSICNDPFDILADRNAGGSGGMETSSLSRGISTLVTHEFLKGSGKGRNEHLDGGIRESLHLHLGRIL
jgi:hypothetical protein